MTERTERTVLILILLVGYCIIIIIGNVCFDLDQGVGFGVGYFGCLLLLNYDLLKYLAGTTKPQPLEKKKKSVTIGFQ